MSAVLANVRDLLIPPRCAGCGAAGAWLCVACRDLCDPAGLALTARLRARGAATFAGPVREAIHAYKYRGERGLALELGALVARLVAHDLATGQVLDAVIPVPLHRHRARERGYDQAALLAAAVAASCDLPLLLALHRIRWSDAQVALDRTARERNVRGAFVGSVGSLQGLRIALIDDVATTGATLRAAAVAARACGARVAGAYVVAIDA